MNTSPTLLRIYNNAVKQVKNIDTRLLDADRAKLLIPLIDSVKPTNTYHQKQKYLNIIHLFDDLSLVDGEKFPYHKRIGGTSLDAAEAFLAWNCVDLPYKKQRQKTEK